MSVIESTYAEIKRDELPKSLYSCLSSLKIYLNPHQNED